MPTIERGSLPSDNFTMLSNEWIRDDELSFKARGVLSWLSSHALGFRVSLERIAARSKRDGVTAVRSAIKELEAAGYLVRRKERDSAGRITSSVYVLQDPNAQVTPMMRKPDDGVEDANAQVTANMRFYHDGETPSLENSFIGETSPLKKNISSKKTKNSKKTGADLAVVPDGAVDAGTELETRPDNAQTVLTEYVDWCGTLGQVVPSRVKGHLAREIKQLLTDGFDVRTVKLALARWHEKGAHPSALASFTQEAQRAETTGPPGGRTADRVNAALELSRRLAEQEAAAR